MKIKNDPIQFDFSKHWQDLIMKYGHKCGVSRAFNNILETYEEILVEFKYENFENPKSLIDFDLNIAKSKHRDLSWLRENFDGADLAFLGLEFACELFPKKSFWILERNDDAVVTDSNRTIVFDLKNFDLLSSKGSLVLAADDFFFHDNAALEEATAFMEQRLRERRSRIGK